MLIDGQLDFSAAAYCLDGARELGDNTVACASEDAPFMVRDRTINDLTALESDYCCLKADTAGVTLAVPESGRRRG